ncbi:MAG TPA: hypothetical protein VNU71_13465 [Burkholderiaceae bacterium]|nr:hypothetical protein [Burkholderiaceae bacterium]
MSAVLADRPISLDEALGPEWRSLVWRLHNLYWIVDEHGKAVKFEPNEEQLDLVQNLHTRNLILKARQLGFSTLIEILELDQGLFNADHTGAVIADTLPNAGKLFAKVEFAVARLPIVLQQALPIKRSNASTTILWEHGSQFYVSTSPRGGTVQFLHVSELGKIARKYPERAAEIVSGGFEAVPQDGVIVVESTAEGAFGAFYDLCSVALKRQAEGAPETPLDWRLHFYPWFKKGSYRLDAALVIVNDADHKYFNALQAKLGVTIDPGQRAWYVKKRETLGRLMKREYPSTPEEAFEQAVEGAVFGDEMTTIREKGRITTVPLDVSYPVDTYWDFGLGARNPIWLKQRIGMQNRWVKYFDDFGKGLGWWWRHLETWRMEHGEFRWGRHFLPHDADTQVLGESVETKAGILEAAGMRNIIVVPRVSDKTIGIDLMRAKLVADNWIDREHCAEGIRCLDGYQFEWNEKLGRWSNVPLGNWASHGADAFMQYAQTDDATNNSGTDIGLSSFKGRKRNWR